MPNNALGLTALTDLSKQLKTTDKVFASAIRKNLRAGIKKAGSGVLDRVKAKAAWSSRIPGATSLSIRYKQDAASVRIQVNHNKAPHARPYELGNKNSFIEADINRRGGYQIVNGRRVAVRHAAYKEARKAGAFSKSLRHPVFNKGGYADEPTRPFFFPAIAEQKGAIDQDMEQAVIQTAKDAGFK
jgi:hypothetical protein